MRDPLAEAVWPPARIGEALERLAPEKRAGAAQFDLSPAEIERLAGPPEEAEGALIAAAERAGFEAESLAITHADLRGLLRAGAPFLVRHDRASRPGYLLAIRSGARNLALVLPRGGTIGVAVDQVAEILGEPLEAPHRPAADQLLDEAGVPPRSRPAVRRRLLAGWLSGRACATVWRLSRRPGASFVRRLVEDRVAAFALAFLSCTLAAQAAWIGSWWILGRAAWRGDFGADAFVPWVLLMASNVALRAAADWSRHVTGMRLGAATRQRLLEGALRLDVDAARRRGVGQWFSVVLESQWIESTGLETAFASIVGLVELASAALLMTFGVGGALHAGFFIAWVLVLGAGIGWVVSLCRAWTECRLRLTQDMVEKLVGHRTRVAQEPIEQWHREDDALLADYHTRSRALDDAQATLTAVAARGWLILGCLGLLPALADGRDPGARWAASIAGMVLGYLSLRRVTNAIATTAAVAVAWSRVGPLVRAGADPASKADPAPEVELPEFAAGDPDAPPLIEGRDLSFDYSAGGAPVLDRCEIRVAAGDRLLLTGPSGSGKSTLAAILAGLRSPSGGRVVARGIDLDALAPAARRRTAAIAPQFHENHVLTETFAFNLLMGRRWPPRPADLAEAGVVCRELGLGELLDRMPAGMFQQIGETGWQLSHGERSRLFVARALLQVAPVVILDESFGALDPDSLHRCLDCIERRAEAVVLIAHR